jgi:hypothetical protein
MDDVEMDLTNMSVKRWRKRALDETEWARPKLKVCSVKEEEEEEDSYQTRQL